jgi:hypothetical protein
MIEKMTSKIGAKIIFQQTFLNLQIVQYVEVVKWAKSMEHHYLPKAFNEFLGADEADAFLVAYALSDKNNRIIVTQEVSNPFQKNRIKIPEPCNALGVQFINTINLFRYLKENF